MKSKKISLEFESREANFLKLLVHPVRIAILKILRNEEACVCHMEALLGYRQAYLSQQLAVLREAGIISDRKVGWNVYYQIQNFQVLDILKKTSELFDPDHSRIPDIPACCPCPKCSQDQINVPKNYLAEMETTNVND